LPPASLPEAGLAFWFRICEPEFLRVLSHKPIVLYSVKHPEAAASLDTWYRVTRRLDWKSLEDVKSVFPSVDRVGSKFVFNIAHNRHRLIAEINFKYRSGFVRAILSHAEYDRGGWEE
jgi:mRNA interferase HigB